MYHYFGGQFTGPKREIMRSPNVSFNKLIVARAVTCCAVLLKPQLPHIHVMQFMNKAVLNHVSVAVTIDSNVLTGIVFEEVRANDSSRP